ncbi:MAG TPA: hypothetical protein VKB79_27975 [Bryobacteraceae bacterium]|nr:hypothetical protein [Bryobacteraceae bacterium]
MNLVLAYKNFAANRAVSHIGLGVTALNAVKTMRGAGVNADIWPIISAPDLRARLRSSPQTGAPTHIVVSAPWIATQDLAQLCAEFPNTRFAINCHSNLGFLQADPNALRLVREGLELSRATWNFRIAANCERLARWVEAAYATSCLCLPNMYHLDQLYTPREPYTCGTLRIGAFGATRALKNLLTAAGAALEIANRRAADLEFWISSGRNEGAGPVLDAVRQMMNGLAHVKLVENGWQTWPQFRQTVRHMHLLLQPSYTESFNVVTADGVAEGVPSVVSHAIDWAPSSWKAEVDDAEDIARKGLKLLGSRRAAKQGLEALKNHNRRAFVQWMNFLHEPARTVKIEHGRSNPPFSLRARLSRRLLPAY